jgi:hypothetical protein
MEGKESSTRQAHRPDPVGVGKPLMDRVFDGGQALVDPSAEPIDAAAHFVRPRGKS